MKIFKKNSVVKGNVTGIEKYGIFVNIDKKYSGLIHISEISYDFVKDISDYVDLGEEIYVKIVDKNDASGNFKLSIKDIKYKEDGSEIEHIKETEHGFNTLKEKLDEWIEKKINEINKYN